LKNTALRKVVIKISPDNRIVNMLRKVNSYIATHDITEMLKCTCLNDEETLSNAILSLAVTKFKVKEFAAF